MDERTNTKQITMAQQTAAEWLVEQLARKHKEFQALTFYYDHKEEIEQAKQMEKDHLMMAYNDGRVNAGLKQSKKSEQYYNETYNK